MINPIVRRAPSCHETSRPRAGDRRGRARPDAIEMPVRFPDFL